MERPEIETGTVLKTEGSWATVITNKSKSCKECGKAQAGICGKSGAGLIMRVRNTARAQAGDTVLLELERATHVKAYFLVFVLPVVALFLGGYAGTMLSQYLGTEGLEPILGLAGLVLAITYSFNRLRSMDRTAQLQIIKVLYAPPDETVTSCAEETDYIAAFGRN